MIDLEFINKQVRRRDIYSDEVRINCPECNDDKFHMYCNLNKMVYICHKCGAKGKIRKQVDVEDYKKLWNLIGNAGNFPKYKPKNFSVPIKVKNLPRNTPIFDIVPAHPAMIYLNNREITRQDCIDYNIRLSLDKTGPYRDTIIFPVWGQFDDLKYFVCRRYTNQKPKYINAPWPKQDTLFFSDTPIKLGSPIVIVEGIIDAISVGKCGYRSIALLGKVPTSQQLIKLMDTEQNIWGNKICIYLDHDAFSQALDIKLKFAAMDKIANIIYDYKDANELLVEGNLERFLDEQTKHL